MTYTVAITGKGGTGKTTVAAFLVRLLLERNITPVLAVDADPNSSLAPLVGLTTGPTISDIREEILAEKARVTGVPKERILGMKLEECLIESNGFDVLTMGRPEGPTCYCYINNLLRGALAALKANYRVTVVDNEAGMEHLSRMNTDNIDCLVTVCEPTVVSARAAHRIAELADSLPVTVRRKVLVWNKVRASGIPEAAEKALAGTVFDETLRLPDDDAAQMLSATEESALTAEMPAAFAVLVDTCLKGIEGTS